MFDKIIINKSRIISINTKVTLSLIDFLQIVTKSSKEHLVREIKKNNLAETVHCKETKILTDDSILTINRSSSCEPRRYNICLDSNGELDAEISIDFEGGLQIKFNSDEAAKWARIDLSKSGKNIQTEIGRIHVHNIFSVQLLAYDNLSFIIDSLIASNLIYFEDKDYESSIEFYIPECILSFLKSSNSKLYCTDSSNNKHELTQEMTKIIFENSIKFTYLNQSDTILYESEIRLPSKVLGKYISSTKFSKQKAIDGFFNHDVNSILEKKFDYIS